MTIELDEFEEALFADRPAQPRRVRDVAALAAELQVVDATGLEKVLHACLKRLQRANAPLAAMEQAELRVAVVAAWERTKSQAQALPTLLKSYPMVLLACGASDEAARALDEAIEWLRARSEQDPWEALLAAEAWGQCRHTSHRLGGDRPRSDALRVVEALAPRLGQIDAARVREKLRYGVITLYDLFADAERLGAIDAFLRRVWPELMSSEQQVAVTSVLAPFFEGTPAGRLRRFCDFPLIHLDALCGILGDRLRDGRHNSAPSPRELLAHFGVASTRVFVDGYFVHPPRIDSRVSIDAVTAPIDGFLPQAWLETAEDVRRDERFIYCRWD